MRNVTSSSLVKFSLLELKATSQIIHPTTKVSFEKKSQKSLEIIFHNQNKDQVYFFPQTEGSKESLSCHYMTDEERL